MFIPSEVRQGEEIVSYADGEGYCQILRDSNVTIFYMYLDHI